jgi:DNA-binding transcriptional LysR family regulator
MFNGLEVFLAVARTLNMTRAAEQLNLTQSTVSKRLQSLEREVGTSLIERSQGSKTIRLTPAGCEFVDLAQRMYSLWNESQRLRLNIRTISLAIGSLDSLNYAVFPSLYHSLSKHEPKLHLKLITSHSLMLYNLIERREVDVAFTLRERSQPTVVVEEYYREPMVVLRIRLASPPESGAVHPRDLDPRYELYQPQGLSYQIWHDKWWDPVYANGIFADTSQVILSLFSDEQQWAIVPLSVAKMAATRGNFSIFSLTEAPPERIIYKITHKYPSINTSEGLKILDQYLAVSRSAMVDS